MKALKHIIFVLTFVVLFFSCRKDFERPNWDVDLLAPLIKTTLTLDNLISDSILQTNADTSLKLVYQTEIIDIEMDSIFQIPDTTLSETYTFLFSFPANPGSTFYSSDNEKELSVSNGVELNYVKVESGSIEIEIFSEIHEKIIMTYTIPSATKNGDTLVLEEVIPAGTFTQNGYIKKTIDLSGYELDLTGISKAEVNTIVTRAKGVLHPSASAINIPGGTKLIYRSNLIDIVPFFVRGYFGSQHLHFGPETTESSAFGSILKGTLDLDDVTVNLEFNNGIGVDAQLVLNQFSSTNSGSGITNSLAHTSINSALNLNRSVLTNSVPEVIYSPYTINLNSVNSNIDQLIEILPDQISYEMDLFINPLGNISGGNDFVYKKHSLETNLNIEFPLSLIANDLTLQDTVDFSLSSEGKSGNILDGTFYLYAQNGFPFDAEIQLALYDKDMNFLQNFDIKNIIQSANVGADLKVIEKKESVLSIPLSSSTIENLYKTEHILFSIGFTTTAQPQFVKIYEGYGIDIKIVGDFTYNVTFD